MASSTNEQALESSIEKKLTGTCIEDLKEHNLLSNLAEANEQYRAGNGYYIGQPQDYNQTYAIDERRFWHFLEAIKEEEINKLR